MDDARFSLAFPVAKDASARLRPGERARQALVRDMGLIETCAASEGNWYAILRARELLGCDPRRTLELAAQAQRAVPKSVWIATVRARLLGTVAAAEAALALDPGHVPAQLALAAALLNDKQTHRAAALLRTLPSDEPSEAAGLKGRVRLLANDPRRAATEATRENGVGAGGDALRIEPTAGLDWPWTAVQVRALASAQLGKAREAARWLVGVPVGTLGELREALEQHTKAAQQLMNAMALLIEDSRDLGVPRDAAAVALARLRVLAGQPDAAAALVSASPQRMSAFCTGLSVLLWSLGPGEPRTQAEQLRALCTPKTPNAAPVTEPMACSP